MGRGWRLEMGLTSGLWIEMGKKKLDGAVAKG